MEPITYDYLVFGLGARVNYFGVEGADEHAFPMYTLNDAVRLKEHVLRRWEAADRDPSLIDDGALHVVVVGGGATGVESVGALAELYRSDFSKDYPRMPTEQAQLSIVEAGPALFSMFDHHQAAGIRAGDLGGLGRGGPARRGRRIGLADPRQAQVRPRAAGAHPGLGRGPAGSPAGGRDRGRA